MWARKLREELAEKNKMKKAAVHHRYKETLRAMKLFLVWRDFLNADKAKADMVVQNLNLKFRGKFIDIVVDGQKKSDEELACDDQACSTPQQYRRQVSEISSYALSTIP